jgi:hypothetical protein
MKGSKRRIAAWNHLFRLDIVRNEFPPFGSPATSIEDEAIRWTQAGIDLIAPQKAEKKRHLPIVVKA